MATAERLVRSWMVSEKDSEVDESVVGTLVVATCKVAASTLQHILQEYQVEI